MKLARMAFLKKVEACIIIQSYFRMYLHKKNFLQIKRSVSVLQMYFINFQKGRNERIKYLELKRSTVLIQSVFRGFLFRKQLKMRQEACVRIQTGFRSYICHKRFMQKKQAVMVLQRFIRAWLIAQQTRKLYLSDRKCIVKSQAIIKGWLVRKEYKKLKKAAIKIQSSYRGYVCRKTYLKKRKAIITLQKYFKAYLVGKTVCNSFMEVKCSALVIQSAWRMRKARQLFLKKRKVIVLLQSHVRKIIMRKKYLKLKRITNAVVVIQRSFRKWKEYKRDSMGKNEQHQWYMKLKDSITQFQRHARFFIEKRKKAAIIIQNFFKKIVKQKKMKREKAALKLQALWRGYVVRSHITDTKIVSARQKINIDIENEYNWLCNRTKRSLEILLNPKKMTRILTALQELDVCTRLSPVCCIKLEQSGGLSVLVKMIKSCNRSEPHKELISYCMNILLNIAKYDKTVNSVWRQEDMLDTVIKLMKVYKDNSFEIFNKCCSLLYIFCHDPVKAKWLRECEEFILQVGGIHESVLKKYKMEKKRCNLRESVQIDPEWLLGKHRKREFKDPILGITSVKQILNS